jgi:hypothetical protein
MQDCAAIDGVVTAIVITTIIATRMAHAPLRRAAPNDSVELNSTWRNIAKYRLKGA